MKDAPQRLARMRKTFAKERGVLVEDYQHFTRPATVTTPDAPTLPSKAVRTSAERSEPRRPKRS